MADAIDSYRDSLGERKEYHEGLPALERKIAQAAVVKSLPSDVEADPSKKSASPAAPAEGGTGEAIRNALANAPKIPGPLDVLGKVSEVLSGPARMLLLKAMGKPIESENPEEFTTQDFVKNLSVIDPANRSGLDVLLGLGATIATDVTTAMPLGPAKTAVEAVKGVREAGAVLKGLNKTLDKKELLLDKSLPVVAPKKGQVSEVQQVPVAGIKPAVPVKGQTPKTVDPNKVKAMKGDIEAGKTKAMGPITVNKDPKTGELTLVDGEHRLQAARESGIDTITASVNREKNAKELVGETIKADPAMSADKARVMQEAVGVPTSALGRHAQAAFKKLDGDDVPVIDDEVGKTFGYKLDGTDDLSDARYSFAQDVTREESAKLNIPNGEYQDVFKAAGQAVRENTGNIQALIQDTLKKEPELLDDLKATTEVTGKVMGLDESGKAGLMATLFMTRVMVGAGIGAAVNDEDRLTGALTGAGIAASPELVKGLSKLFAKRAENTPPPNPGSAQAGAQRTPKSAWTQKEVNDLYKQTADVLKARQAALHTPRPHTLVEKEAERLLQYQQVTPETLRAMTPGRTLNDAQLRAAQLTLRASADHLHDMATAVDMADKGQVAEVLKQLYVHANTDFGREIAQTELGRALNIIDGNAADNARLNEMKDIVSRVMTGSNPERIIELLRQTGNADHLAKFSQDMARPGFKDMFVEYWVNGLLSGLRTMVINPATSALFHGWNIGERGMSLLYGNATGPAEAIAMVRGSLEAAGTGFKLMAKSLWTEQPPKLDAGKPEMAHFAITGENVAALSPVKSVRDVLNPVFSKLDQYGPISTAMDFISQAATSTVDAAGRMIRFPGRVVLAQDEFFKAVSFQAELHAQAVREATAEVEAQGLVGKAAREAYNAAYKRILETPPSSVERAAKNYSFYSTFTKALGDNGRKIQELTKSSVLAKAAVPFLVAPTNLMKTGFLERTPLGIVSKTFRDELMAGGERQQLALTRMSTGAAFVGLATTWAAKGWIQGAGPENLEQRKQLRQKGFVPYSVNVSQIMRDLKGEQGKDPGQFLQEGDIQVDFSKLDPVIAPALGLAANYTDVVGKLSWDDSLETASAITMAVGQFVGQKSWMSGAAGITGIISDPEHGLSNWLTKQAGTLVPASSFNRSLARELDPVMRDPDTLWDSIKAGIPVLSQTVKPDRNRYGEEVHYPPALGPDMASPFFVNRYTKDPVLEAAVEDNVVFSKIPNYIGNTVLPDDVYDELRVIFGQEAIRPTGQDLRQAEEEVLQRAKDEQHTVGPDSWRASELRKVDHEYKARAQKILMRRYPDLAKTVMQDEAERFSKMDKPAMSNLESEISIADQDGFDVKPGKSKSANIPFNVR